MADSYAKHHHITYVPKSSSFLTRKQQSTSFSYLSSTAPFPPRAAIDQFDDLHTELYSLFSCILHHIPQNLSFYGMEKATSNPGQ